MASSNSSDSRASAEVPAPYGTGPTPAQAPSSDAAPKPAPRVRIHHLQQAKRDGTKFAMLTAYEQYTAEIFDQAGIEVLLVGDSASNNVFGNETSLPVTVDELLPLCRAVARSAKRALVVADLPFGSYEVSAQQAVATGVRFLKEGLAHAVKIEGGAFYAETVRAMVQAGIPVMAHIGFTPQSEHALGGYRVQGRGDDAQRLIDDAVALADAGAFSILMEMVPAGTAAAVDAAVSVPTVGIGAGKETTGQVLVWQDMAGLRGGKMAKFVKQYADLRGTLSDAAKAYGDDVRSGQFPGPGALLLGCSRAPYVKGQSVLVALFPGVVPCLDLFQGVLRFFACLVGADQLAPVRERVLFHLVGVDVVPVLSHGASSFRRQGCGCGCRHVIHVT